MSSPIFLWQLRAAHVNVYGPNHMNIHLTYKEFVYKGFVALELIKKLCGLKYTRHEIPKLGNIVLFSLCAG